MAGLAGVGAAALLLNMKHASLAKVWQSFSPKFQVPNMHYWLKFADVSVVPNFECQICVISGLKFD